MAKGSSGLQNVGKMGIGIAGVIVAAVVALILLSTLAPTFFSSVKNLSTNFSTADTGNATANSLGSVFSLLISLGGIFALVGLAFAAYHLKGKW